MYEVDEVFRFPWVRGIHIKIVSRRRAQSVKGGFVWPINENRPMFADTLVHAFVENCNANTQGRHFENGKGEEAKREV